MTQFHTPKTDLEGLAELGTENLARVIAIDSQSDERSTKIPSTEGQRRLAEYLAKFFGELGFEANSDEHANLLVEIPASDGCRDAPILALMVHIDTSRGTQAIDKLEELRAWDGSRIPFPKNDKLQVTADNYPETGDYLGEHLLFGPGEYPIGLDDKLGMCELMTLGQVLAAEPEIPHGEILLICRPDEEIGRMEAVEGLAERLAQRGVRCGYTIDGLGPFEVQVENFNASKAVVQIPGQPLDSSDAAVARRVTVRVVGCKSHGATAKPEGYLNATVICTRLWQELADHGGIHPVGFQSDVNSEVNADVTFLLRGADSADLDSAESSLMSAIQRQLEPHRWKGAQANILSRQQGGASESTNALMRAFDLLGQFLSSQGPEPLLSEDSEKRQGYSNPYFMELDNDTARVDFRLRAFVRDELDAREAHVCALAKDWKDWKDGKDGIHASIEQQYTNMGPSLKPYPELVDWAVDAASTVGFETRVLPIRGGTGVDPFVARGIPIANLGTGYFAPESEKEFTSRQKIAQHAAWLVQLVQRVAVAATSATGS